MAQPSFLSNLLIMAFLWLAVVFNYYLLLYMINSFRLVYLSAIGNSLSDLTGNYLGYKL